MKNSIYTVRNAHPSEFEEIGKLMLNSYSQLEGFPNKDEQPQYYEMLANIGNLTQKPNTELLVAVSKEGNIGGGVVYFSDMKYYGSGGTATQEKNASGFRLLAVNSSTRGQGLGKLLSLACIKKAKALHQDNLVIHTTKSMQIAWGMYEELGFKRATDLDFSQGDLLVYGFRLSLS